MQATTSLLGVSNPGRAGGLCPDSSRRLRELVDAHLAFVWRTLRRGGVSEADADDAAQRVFLTVSRRLDEVRAGSERAFLYAVAQGEASHLRRSYKRRAEVGQEPLDERSTGRPRPDELVGRQQALGHARRVLDEMDETLRQVFVLFEVEDLSCREIASLLGIPLGTVKSRLLRARESFRARIAELRLARSSP